MKTDAKQKAMWPPGREDVKSPTATTAEAARGKKRSPAEGEASPGEPVAPLTEHRAFRLLAPATGGRINVLRYTTQCLVICCKGHRKLTQRMNWDSNPGLTQPLHFRLLALRLSV